MYIHEAIRATEQNPRGGIFIRRKGWPYNKMYQSGYKVRITNAPGGCIVYSPDLLPEKWVPSADDLAADDWDTCL